MKRFAFASIAASLLLSGCLSSSRMPSERPVGGELSPKLGPFSFFEDGSTLFLAVDGRAAQYTKEEKQSMFPLLVALANQTMGSLDFNRESFILETAAGQRYPVVSVEEFNRDYDRSAADQRLAEDFDGMLRARFINYNLAPHLLFPARGTAATVQSSFELGRLQWTRFYLYFPMPADGIHGKGFDLLVRPSEMSESFLVHFELR